MEETEVWSLVQEDPTRLGATKGMLHNYRRARSLEPVLRSKSSHRIDKPEPHS